MTRRQARLMIIGAMVESSAEHGGLVPIPALRRLVDLPVSTFDSVLLELERDRVVHLKIANDRRGLTGGIERDGDERLYYYVIVPS